MLFAVFKRENQLFAHNSLIYFVLQTHGLQTSSKPTTKNLNNHLLKFIQGAEIQEKEFGIPEIDGKQVVL